MKNWLKSLTVTAALALVILPCVLFSACSSDHTPGKGDTYVFDKIEYQWAEGVSDEDKATVETMMKMMEGSKIEFTSKTEFSMKAKMAVPGSESQTVEVEQKGTYTIADGKVTMTVEMQGQSSTQVFTIKGKTLVSEETEDGTTTTITYKLS